MAVLDAVAPRINMTQMFVLPKEHSGGRTDWPSGRLNAVFLKDI